MKNHLFRLMLLFPIMLTATEEEPLPPLPCPHRYHQNGTIDEYLQNQRHKRKKHLIQNLLQEPNIYLI